mgnify:CR=1 FL=1
MDDGALPREGGPVRAGGTGTPLDRARAPDSVNAQKALFADIEAVEAVAPDLVRVTLKAPDADFPWKMAWGDAVMMDPASAADAATKPVGTGPFKLGEWTQGDHVTLTAFDGYWGEKEPWQRVLRKELPNDAARVAQLKAGQVDIIVRAPTAASTGRRARRVGGRSAMVPTTVDTRPGAISRIDEAPTTAVSAICGWVSSSASSSAGGTW